MADLSLIHGWNMIIDVRTPMRWVGKFIGKNIYEYTLDSPNEKYIAMDGLDVDSYFSVPHDFRLVALKFKQTTAAGADSNAPISVDLYERIAALGDEWGAIVSDAGNFMYWAGREGETWETSACDYRIRLNGTDGHLVYPILTLQYLKDTMPRSKRNR